MTAQTRGAALLQYAQEARSQPATLRRPRVVVAAPRYASRRCRGGVQVSAFGGGRSQSVRLRYDKDLGLGDSGDAVRCLQSDLSVATVTGVRLYASHPSCQCDIMRPSCCITFPLWSSEDVRSETPGRVR